MKTLFNSALGKNCLIALGFFFLFFITHDSLAQGTFRSTASGNWYNASTWDDITGLDADGIPDSDDDVYVRGGFTVTIDNPVLCNTLQVGGVPNISGQSFNGLGVLNFGGSYGVTVNPPLT